MRWLMAGIGGLVSIGLLGVSMAMNFQFGLTLGRDPVNSWIYGVASVCGDGLKALAPFALAWGWRERRFGVALAALLLFLVSTLYSLTSALGFAALTRAETAGAQTLAATRLDGILQERQRLLGERDRLGAIPPSAAIEAAIRAAEQHRRWRSTSGCTDATVPRSIAFCEAYFTLQSERASAERMIAIDTRLAAIARALQETEAGAASGAAEPQIAALAQLLALETALIQLGLLVLVTAFVELGSGLGLFVTLAPFRAMRRLPQAELPAELPEPIEPAAPAPVDASETAWAAERLVQQAGAATALTDLFADYAAWCAARGRRDPLSPAELAALLEGRGHDRTRSDGRERLSGLRLIEARDSVVAFRPTRATSPARPTI